MGDRPSDKNGKILGKISSVLSASTRDTDVTGWYANDCVVGVMFTEIAAEDSASIPGTIIARVTDTLRSNLALEQFNRVRISFHVFPEQWDHEDHSGSSNPDALSGSVAARRWQEIIPRAEAASWTWWEALWRCCFLMPAFLAIAAAVKATSKGPIFFRQRRIGQHGKSFVFLKFRSMQVNNDAAIHKAYVQKLIAGKADKQPSNGNGEGVYKLTQDPRITESERFCAKPAWMNFLSSSTC